MNILSEVLFLVATCLLTEVSSNICPSQNQSADLRFTRKLGRNDSVQIYHAVAILCCAEGYDNITWSRKEGVTWTTFPPPSSGDDNAAVLQENKQVLRFYSTKLTDQTTYRCVASKDSTLIQHDTYLRVLNCDKLARGPIITAPFPENQTIDDFGVNVTFHCTGYFGCTYDPNASEHFAWWVMPNGHFVQNESERYKVKTTYNKTEFKKQATLTIDSVNEDDLSKTFVCLLLSYQEKHNHTIEIVNIKKRDKPDFQSTSTPWLKIGLSIAGGLVFIAFILVLTVFIRYKYWPQIRLFLSSRIASLGPRYISNEKYLYNVFIYHADADDETALHMKKKLHEENYEVFINADTEGNQNVLRTFSEKTSQSALVLFLYSEALRNDNLANFLLQSFISERKGKDIMFLEVADYNPKEILDWARHAKDKEKLIEKSVDEHREDIDDETVEMIRQQEIDVVDDLKFWKVLPRLKVPAAGSSEREMRFFWCSLQNRIPKFVDHRLKSTRKGSVGKENVLTHQENKMKNTIKDEKAENFIPLTHSRNDDETVRNGVEINNTVLNIESFIDIPETSSHEASQDHERETPYGAEGLTIVGARKHSFNRMEEGHSLISNQSSSCRGEIRLEENMSFEDMTDIIFEESNARQIKKCGDTVKQRNNNLNLIIKLPPSEHGPSSCSPESGYVTSPVEKNSSIEGFLPER